MSAGALARIQKAAVYGRVRLTSHAEDEADNANAQARDIAHAIQTATSAVEQEGGRYRLEGGTYIDGTLLVVVVREVPQGLLIITVF